MTLDTLSKDKAKIEQMFDSIAPKYDFLNHALSFNIDKPWRRKLIKHVINTNPQIVLDLACGTGDVTRGLYKEGVDVIGLDLSEGMLAIARKKSDPAIKYVKGAADLLPFENESFDAVTIAFGIRNFDNRPTCLEEINRVLRPGGMLAILEFTIPKNPIWRGVYSFYFKNVLPVIGGMISKNKAAYKYLPLSAFDFPQREAFCKELAGKYEPEQESPTAMSPTAMETEFGKQKQTEMKPTSPTAMTAITPEPPTPARFNNAVFKSLLAGVACIYLAHKPMSPADTFRRADV